jgi:hypothetical protein
MEETKPIKETNLGKWLKEKAPHLLDKVGDLMPDKGVLGIVKRMVDTDPDISPEQKMEFEKLAIEKEMNAQDNVSRRWEADMSSDVKIAKIIRPVIMIALLVFFMVVTIWDSISLEFSVRENYVDLLQILLLTTAGAYFAGRTIEKVNKK